MSCQESCRFSIGVWQGPDRLRPHQCIRTSGDLSPREMPMVSGKPYPLESLDEFCRAVDRLSAGFPPRLFSALTQQRDSPSEL